MLSKDPSVFQHSENPRELVDMARIYAASEEIADQTVVLQQLNSQDYLSRLNTDEEYVSLSPRGLNVARVVKTLMDQTHPAAINTLVELTQAATFQSHYPLVELNIQGLSSDRPASPRTIAYWDHHSHPESSNIDIVMEAIFANRSEPALRLFERKMNDPAQDDMRKSTWLKDPLLRRRNELDVLLFSESMLTANTLLSNWHNPLLEVLFDYNEHWYLSCSFPRPPERAMASPEAKEVLARIGRHSLTQMQIAIPGLVAKIKAVMQEIGHEWQEDDAQA